MSEATNETRAKGNSKGLLLAFGLVVLAAIAIGAYFYFNKSGENATGSGPAATVNGAEIPKEDYDRSVRQMSQVFASQGMDVNSAEISSAIKDQAINTLINRQLIKEAADAAGISVSDAEVETEYQNISSGLGGNEGLQTALKETGMDETGLRAEIRSDILINKYLEAKLGTDTAEVTDEEVQAAYDTAAANVTSEEQALPPLEEIKELIHGQLVNEKRQQLINTELERLRGSATIVLHI